MPLIAYGTRQTRPYAPDQPLMITDTAYFRYPHYHQTTDTPDKVDVNKLARITHGVERVIREMALP